MIQWLRPGLRVKRWLGLLFLGMLLCGLGVALLLVQLYREFDFGPGTSGALVYFLFLEFIGPQWLRGVILIGVSGVVLIGALLLFNRTLLAPFAKGGSIVDIVLQRKQLQRGPKVVAIGGGHGLATLLHGVKEHTSNLTAIVTVADDGGSSGRLRKAFHIPAPGESGSSLCEAEVAGGTASCSCPLHRGPLECPRPWQLGFPEGRLS